MEMILLLSLCLITAAAIERQHAAMRRIKRVRLERDE